VPGVRNLGFVDVQDKIDAYAAAVALCLPSLYESFSIVIMESWLQETPVIVSKACAVTRDHCEDSSGGFAVASAEEFGEAVVRLLADPGLRSRMGAAGRDYVRRNYAPETVTRRFVEFIRALP
jgi:glycosyltransferase involved in cell wall biosynthesis